MIELFSNQPSELELKFDNGLTPKNDVIKFIEQIKTDKPDLKNLGIRGTNLDEMLD